MYSNDSLAKVENSFKPYPKLTKCFFQDFETFNFNFNFNKKIYAKELILNKQRLHQELNR